MWSKARGLMFRSRPQTLAMFFERPVRVSLHMWFVFFSIDVLFLDKHNRIVERVLGFRPFTCYTSQHRASVVVEMPAGTIAKKHYAVQDIVELRKR